MTRWHLPVLVAVLAQAPGCSLFAARGPKLPVADLRRPIACNPSRSAAGLDVAAGSALSILGLVAVAAPCGGGILDCDELKTHAAMITLLPGALLLGSGFHGFGSAHDCRKALALQERCRAGDGDACLALTGGPGLEIKEPADRPSGTFPAP